MGPLQPNNQLVRLVTPSSCVTNHVPGLPEGLIHFPPRGHLMGRTFLRRHRYVKPTLQGNNEAPQSVHSDDLLSAFDPSNCRLTCPDCPCNGSLGDPPIFPKVQKIPRDMGLDVIGPLIEKLLCLICISQPGTGSA